MTAPRTPLAPEAQAPILEHVNDEHVPELLLVACALTDARRPVDARLTALFVEGFEMTVRAADGEASHFIAYAAPGPAHTAIRATVAEARQRLGEVVTTRRLRGTVRSAAHVTPHLRRLTLHLGADALPDWAPGYACRFALNAAEPEGASRPYTVRRVDPARGTAEVDVYCHDDTPGSLWALGLAPGDAVAVTAGRPERFPDFDAGRALLCGDETALPTIAALLEGWAHERGPRVLLEVGDAAEQRYLDDVALPRGTHLRWLPRVGEPGATLRRAVTLLEDPPGAVWAALSTDGARALRTFLREEGKLAPAQYAVLGYWKQKAT